MQFPSKNQHAFENQQKYVFALWGENNILLFRKRMVKRYTNNSFRNSNSDSDSSASPNPVQAPQGLNQHSRITNYRQKMIQKLRFTWKKDKLMPKSDLHTKLKSFIAVKQNSYEENTSSSEFTCPICLQMLTTPCPTSCGHVFCFKCIDETIVRTEKCPTCRNNIRSQEFTESRPFSSICHYFWMTSNEREQYIEKYNRNQEWLKERRIDVKNMKIGDGLDVKDTEHIWCKAKVADIFQSDNKTLFLIHFEGWNQIYNEVINSNSQRLAPLSFFSNRDDIPRYKLSAPTDNMRSRIQYRDSRDQNLDLGNLGNALNFGNAVNIGTPRRSIIANGASGMNRLHTLLFSMQERMTSRRDHINMRLENGRGLNLSDLNLDFIDIHQLSQQQSQNEQGEEEEESDQNESQQSDSESDSSSSEISEDSGANQVEDSQGEAQDEPQEEGEGQRNGESMEDWFSLFRGEQRSENVVNESYNLAPRNVEVRIIQEMDLENSEIGNSNREIYPEQSIFSSSISEEMSNLAFNRHESDGENNQRQRQRENLNQNQEEQANETRNRQRKTWNPEQAPDSQAQAQSLNNQPNDSNYADFLNLNPNNELQHENYNSSNQNQSQGKPKQREPDKIVCEQTQNNGQQQKDGQQKPDNSMQESEQQNGSGFPRKSSP